jgi:hypothetical protein
MKKTFSDPDFSFQANIEDARRERAIKADIADHRRTVAKAKDPRAQKKKPAWEIVPTPKEPAWSFTRDKAGLVVEARENRQHEQVSTDGARGSRYLLEIDRACFVGGEHVEPGCLVDCLGFTAGTLAGLRGRIIKEFAPEA